MRRLRPQESVAINLDDAESQIDCYVRSVSGAIATLARHGGIPPELRHALSPGLLGYLSFAHDDEPVALRGIATADCAPAPDFAFVGLDGIKLPERRSDVRVNLATRGGVCTIDDDGVEIGEPIETITVDLSLGGVLFERRQRMGIGPLIRVELYFGADPRPISCIGKVTRLTATHMGAKFIEMPEAHRARLASVLRNHARRPPA